MKISLGQLAIVKGDVDFNFSLVKDAVRKASSVDSDVIVLPEMRNTSFYPKNIKELADKDGIDIKSKLSNLAREYQINIVGGSVATIHEDRLYNTSYTFDKEGNLIGEYDKVHLFSYTGEDKVFEKGNDMVTFYIEGIKCGIILCYDIRFNERVRKYALDGVEVLFNPACRPEKRINHRELLNKAAAVENQIFVVDVNATKNGDRGSFGGHSSIIDPLGNYIIAPFKEEEVKSAEIDMNELREVREAINIYKDRRGDLY